MLSTSKVSPSRNPKTNWSIFTMPPSLSLYTQGVSVCMLRWRHFDSLLLAHCQTRSLSEIALGIPALECKTLCRALAISFASRAPPEIEMLTLFVLAFGVSRQTPNAKCHSRGQQWAWVIRATTCVCHRAARDWGSSLFACHANSLVQGNNK